MVLPKVILVSAKRGRMKNEKNGKPSTTIPRATPHHRPLVVKSRPQPSRGDLVTCCRVPDRPGRSELLRGARESPHEIIQEELKPSLPTQRGIHGTHRMPVRKRRTPEQ